MAEYENHGNYNGIAVGGLTTGIIGSVLGLTAGGLGNLLGGFGRSANGEEYVTKQELNYVQELGQKDCEIALLKSESNTEVKIADVYERIMTRVNANRREQDAWNASQSVVNAQMASAIAVNTNSISTLQTLCGNLTKVVIPIANVCPNPMPQYNSWAAPTTTTTTG